MSIYYALVARGPIILVDFTEHHGNFEQITTKILQSIDTSQDSKCSYTSESYVFHVMISQGLVFLCMADESMGKTMPYGYLAEIKNKFMGGTLRERAFHCNAYELKHDFSPVLMQQMRRFNRGDVEANSKVKNLQKDVDTVKSVMTENIGKLLERGEKLDVLVDKTEDLSKSSESFARSAKKVRRKMWWQNKKMCLILSCVLFVILSIITLVILYEVGVFSPSNSSSSGGGGGGKTTSPPTTTTTTITTKIMTTIKTTIQTTFKTTASTPVKNVTTILPPTNSTTTPSKI
ncbi:uncharacterized protein [Clytia hemisphaerica]|uniref:Vesicle-associated membrane protein 7 n=1 Tax=Clytia hemisphaerica TaxID=252671 RepID=A0A7M5UYF3_9CNID